MISSFGLCDHDYNPTVKIKFWDLYPTSLSSLDFTATDTDINYFQASATFNFLYMQILDKDGNALTPDYVNQPLQRWI